MSSPRRLLAVDTSEEGVLMLSSPGDTPSTGPSPGFAPDRDSRVDGAGSGAGGGSGRASAASDGLSSGGRVTPRGTHSIDSTGRRRPRRWRPPRWGKGRTTPRDSGLTSPLLGAGYDSDRDSTLSGDYASTNSAGKGSVGYGVGTSSGGRMASAAGGRRHDHLHDSMLHATRSAPLASAGSARRATALRGGRERAPKSTGRMGKVKPLSDDAGSGRDRSTTPDSRASRSPGGMRSPFTPGQDNSMYHKVKYYGRLQQMAGASARRALADVDETVLESPAFVWRPRLLPPPHVLPAYLFGLEDVTTKPQTSWATISSMVNTMLGTTIVSLPFAMMQVGIVLGTTIMCFIGALCCFTCLLVVRRGRMHDTFTEFVRYYLGDVLGILAWLTGIAVILGAAIVYHMLMEMGIYRIVNSVLEATGTETDVWNHTFAACIVLIIFPATILKDLRALVKFNSFGFVFVWYCVVFIIIKGVIAIVDHDVHLKVTPYVPPPPNTQPSTVIDMLGSVSFGSMSGMATLAFYIHNIIQTIAKNADPKVVKRDIILAYMLAGSVYLACGVMGCFALTLADKSVVQLDNILVVYGSQDWYAVTAQFAQVLQLMTVYPLLLLIIRTQLFELIYHTAYPGRWQVVLLSVVCMGITFVFALKVSVVMRFTGAIGGLVIIFLAPILADVSVRKQRGKMYWFWWLLHGGILAIAIGSVVAQFIPALTVG